MIKTLFYEIKKAAFFHLDKNSMFGPCCLFLNSRTRLCLIKNLITVMFSYLADQTSISKLPSLKKSVLEKSAARILIKATKCYEVTHIITHFNWLLNRGGNFKLPSDSNYFVQFSLKIQSH